MDNLDFWLALDNLIRASKIVIDRPKGSKHPRIDFIYEMDYGYLENTRSMDGSGIDVWLGTDREQKCDAVICTIDLMKKDAELKILLGCSEEEKDKILQIHNQYDSMKGIMIRRK